MEIGLLRLAKFTQVITEVVEIGILRPATLHLVITEDMLVDVDLGIKIPHTLPIMLKREVDIGIRPVTLPTITKVTVVYC